MVRSISYFVSLVMGVSLFSFQSFAQLPTATLSGGDQTICANTYANVIITLTGTSPWTFMYIDPSLQSSDNINTITITSSPYTFNVYPKFNEIISAYRVSNSMGIGTASGSINVTVTPNVLPTTIPSQMQSGPVISGPNPINCSLGQTLLTAPAGYNNYQWYLYNVKYSFFEAISSEIGQVVNATKYGGGNYMVRIIDANCISYSLQFPPLTLQPPFPRPVITGNNTFQCGSPNTVLTATSGFVKYEWRLNGDIIQSGVSNTIVANTFGAGIYSVKVYDTNGCNNTSPQLTVSETFSFNAPLITPSVPMRTIVRCAGGQNTLTAPAGFSLYQWKKNNVIVKSGTDNTLDLNQSGYGNGAYSITVVNAQGCKISSAYSTMVNLVPPGAAPILTASPNLINCNGIPSLIQTSPIDNLYQSYLWSDGSTSNTLSVTKAGTYTVTVKDVSGCTNTGSITLTEAPKQNVTISSTSTVTRLCQTDSTTPSVILQSSVSPSGFTKLWYKDGTYITNTPTLTVQNSGVYTLNIVPKPGTSPNICYTQSNDLPIQITAPPLQYSPAKFVCGPAPTYTHLAIGAGVNQVYKWYADLTSSNPLYVSTSSTDMNYISSLASIYVSIYDQLSGCETSRTNLFITIDPIRLPDQDIVLCWDSTSTYNLKFGEYKGGLYYVTGLYRIGLVSEFSENSISFGVPATEKQYAVGYKSPRGCLTTSDAIIKVSIFQPDISIVSYDTSVGNALCAGNSALLKVNNPGVYWMWYDSPTSNKIIKYSNPPSIETWPLQVTVVGNKTYYVKISNDKCITARKAININAIPNPSADFSIRTFCNQEAEVLYTGPWEQNLSYNWDLDGGIRSNGLVGWQQGGNKFISLEVINSQGCKTKKTTMAVINFAPTLDFDNPPASVCQYKQMNVYPQNTSHPGGKFVGSFIGANNYPILYFSEPGNQYVTYEYTNYDGCVYRKSKPIKVNPLPVVSMMGLTTSYCQSTTGIPVTVNPTGGTLSGTGIRGTTFTPSTLGQRTISYNYKDVNNCSNTATQSVTVNPVPIVSFTGLNSSYCTSAASSALTGTPAGGTFSGTGISGNTFTPATVGTNTITYSYTANGCSGAPAVKTTTVVAPLIPSVIITSSAENPGCGSTVTYTATLVNIPVSRTYQWKRNGVSIAGATAITYTGANMANGEKITCQVSYIDACTNQTTTYTSDPYIQTVLSTNSYLKFDGIDDKVTVPSIPQYDVGSGDFTMGAYVSLNANSPISTPIISRRLSGPANGFVFYLYNNQLIIQLNNVNYYSNTFYSLRDSYEHYIAVTRQNGVITFYLDNKAIGNAASTQSINTTANITIGNDPVDNTFLSGYISNAYISNLANDFIFVGIGLLPIPPQGLVGYWMMNDCAGQSIRDYSTYGNTGVAGTTVVLESSDPVFTNYAPSKANGNSVDFTSSSRGNWIEIPAHTTYDFGTATNFTVEARIAGLTSSSSSSEYRTILSKRSTYSDGFIFGVNNNKLFFQAGGVNYYDAASYNLTSSYCNHVAITRSGTTYTFYVNGVKTSSFTSAADINSPRPFWLGNDYTHYDATRITFFSNTTKKLYSLKGIVDEIRIWNVAQPANVISLNKNTASFMETTPNLIGYFTFNDVKNAQWVLDGSALDNYGFLGSYSNEVDNFDPTLTNIYCSTSLRSASDTQDVENVTTLVNAEAIIYPNPFENTARLKIVNLYSYLTIQITDAEGRLVYTKEKHPATEELLVGEGLPQGMYIIQFVGQPLLKPIKFVKVF